MLRISNLCMSYASKSDGHGEHVLKDVSFHIEKGENLGLVGGSGAGKTTLARCLIHLQRIKRGSLWFEGKDITFPTQQEKKLLRQKLQIIWQDPYVYLNPYMNIRDILLEPLRNYKVCPRSDRLRLVVTHLGWVGLSSEVLTRRPHELSIGQCQRVAIARALTLKPKLLICDEALSSLDVPAQIQVIDLLNRLQTETGLTYLFITHDLSLLKHICPWVAVMHQGTIVETGLCDDVFSHPENPHTRELLNSMLHPLQ